jgi:signal peptidase I
MKDVIGKERPFRFQARGFSMSPFIKDEDIITIFPYSDRSPRLGDVVACMQTESWKLIVHRIIDRQKGDCCTKGDSMDSPDGWIPEDRIIGRVGRVERKGKSISLGLGPERSAIAILSRGNYLTRLSSFLWRISRAPTRRQKP